MVKRISLCIALAFSLAACNLVYKQDIQQGNVLDDDDVARLELGMTKRQVQLLLGTPSVHSPFHEDRWDYVNTFAPRGTIKSKRVLTLRFDNNRLASLEGSFLDQDTVAAQALRDLQKRTDQPIQDLESLRRDM